MSEVFRLAPPLVLIMYQERRRKDIQKSKQDYIMIILKWKLVPTVCVYILCTKTL